MRLHDYAASANCYKARLLLSVLDQPYERVPVDIFGGDTLTAAFGRLNPVRETPVLELAPGVAVAQSGAILGYLAEGTAYAGATALERAQVQQWLAFEQERVMMGIGGARFRRLTGRDRLDPGAVAARLATGTEALAILDRHLRDRGWVVGDRCSIADLSLYAYAHVADEAGVDLEPLAGLRAWFARVEALPGFVDDLTPYPPNARPGAGRSIYDA